MNELLLDLQIVEEYLHQRKKIRKEAFRKLIEKYRGSDDSDLDAPMVPTKPKTPTILGGSRRLY